MIVRDWMQGDPVVIAGDTLVSEAKRIVSENNLHALPVVDDGRLRGLVTRANLLRMGHFVLRAQDADEFNYFVTRLKARDVMVRNPATVQADDTLRHCLAMGRELGVAQFPVLDGTRIVGIISANEIFQVAAHCLGAFEQHCGITLAGVEPGPGVLGHIAAVVEATGAELHALYPILHQAAGARSRTPGSGARRVLVLRFEGADVAEVACALDGAGYTVLDAVEPARATAGA
jgi:acetoin utilization protein AcuB